MTIPSFLRAQSDGVLLSVKLQPRASINEIGEPLGAELRIKVTAPPVDAAANEALIRLLAEHLDLPRNRIELIRGHTSRHKVLKLHGLSAETFLAALGPKTKMP
ncbi:MAG: uncharacterized protein QOJ40_1894 [Verrucomicrobiota bacterium]